MWDKAKEVTLEELISIFDPMGSRIEEWDKLDW